MSQTLVQNYVHIIFSTKERRPWFKDLEQRDRMHAYFAGACANQECPVFQVGGTDDHVHILCSLSKNMKLKDVVRDVKMESSKWVKQEFSGFDYFAWQGGYGGFSVSPSHVGPLKKYILGQAEHHRTETFQDEFRRLLRKYGVAYDEKYVWG